MNSRRKGKVGEREFAALLRENGFDARRGQQFCGGEDSPDVVCPALSWLHFEVKRVQNLNLMDACAQAIGDCAGKQWAVAHRRNHAPWLITITAEMFFQFLRGVLPPQPGTSGSHTDRHGLLAAKERQVDGTNADDAARSSLPISDLKGPSGPDEQQQQNKEESKSNEYGPTVQS